MTKIVPTAGTPNVPASVKNQAWAAWDRLGKRFWLSDHDCKLIDDLMNVRPDLKEVVSKSTIGHLNAFRNHHKEGKEMSKKYGVNPVPNYDEPADQEQQIPVSNFRVDKIPEPGVRFDAPVDLASLRSNTRAKRVTKSTWEIPVD